MDFNGVKLCDANGVINSYYEYDLTDIENSYENLELYGNQTFNMTAPTYFNYIEEAKNCLILVKCMIIIKLFK